MAEASLQLPQAMMRRLDRPKPEWTALNAAWRSQTRRREANTKEKRVNPAGIALREAIPVRIHTEDDGIDLWHGREARTTETA